MPMYEYCSPALLSQRLECGGRGGRAQRTPRETTRAARTQIYVHALLQKD
jgi:hypothetical protein